MKTRIRRSTLASLVAATMGALLGAAIQAQTVSAPGPGPAPVYQTGAASRDGIGKFYYHREIAHIMGFEGAAWLERPDRQSEERTDLLVNALHLAPGMNVADVGAGSGYLSKLIAPLIAPGQLFAVDVQPQMVELLRGLASQPGTRNIVPTLGSVDSVNVRKNSIDLAVMVDTYHELSQPHEMVQSIVSALKSGGRLVLVEYRGEDPNVPIKPLHKMTVAQVRLEMKTFPLVLERTDEQLPIQHILVFRKL
ncbi:MAG TPA: methyltransferase domain-containing protein [Steroidobacteraceae bacterium]|nr:methyltransferase domain-containing protein [Steroidobacteraceae bacterium]